MKCPKCGSRVEEGAAFCESCGTRLEPGGQEHEHNKSPRKKSRLPVILVSVVLFFGVIAGICIWIVTGDYHSDSEIKKLAAASSAKEEKAAKEEIRDNEKDADSGKDDKDDARSEQKEEDDSDREKEEKEETYDPAEGGIHRYEYFVSDCTWQEAYENCLAEGGYLVRINSQEEFDYIVSEIESRQMQNIQFKIGGRRDSGSEQYYWVDEENKLYGEQVNTASYWCSGAWMAGEPSFTDGSTQEDCLDIFYYSGENRWVMNDVPNDILSVAPEFSGKLGYICEYED